MAFLLSQQTFTSAGVYPILSLSKGYIAQIASENNGTAVICDANGVPLNAIAGDYARYGSVLLYGTVYASVGLYPGNDTAVIDVLYWEEGTCQAIQTASLTTSMEFFTTVSVPSMVRLIMEYSESDFSAFVGPNSSVAMDGVQTILLSPGSSSEVTLTNFVGSLFIGTNNTEAVGQTVTCYVTPNK